MLALALVVVLATVRVDVAGVPAPPKDRPIARSPTMPAVRRRPGPERLLSENGSRGTRLKARLLPNPSTDPVPSTTTTLTAGFSTEMRVYAN